MKDWHGVCGGVCERLFVNVCACECVCMHVCVCSIYIHMWCYILYVHM